MEEDAVYRDVTEALASQIAGVVQIQNIMIHALHETGALDKDKVAEAMKHVAGILERDVNDHAAQPVKALYRMLTGEPRTDNFADWMPKRDEDQE